MVLKRLVKVQGRTTDALITISDKYLISFNTACVKNFPLNSFSHVIVDYDDESNLVIIQLTNDKDEQGAIKLNNAPDKASTFSAASLFRCNGIKIGNAMRYPAVFDAEENKFSLTLGNGTASKPRAKKVS